MLDKDLWIATNGRPAITPGASITRWLFPSLVSPDYWDLRAIIDLARGNPVYGNFRVATAFNAQASNFLRFAIFVDSVATFLNVLTNNELVIARSPDIVSTGLGTVGINFPVAMPSLNDLALLTSNGARFITLGFEASVPTTDWVAGGVDAFLSPEPLPPLPASHPAGY